MKINNMRAITVGAARVMSAFLVTALASAPSIAKDQLPEVSSDGLHLVKGSKVEIAYVKPGATLDQYTKVMILDCYADFVKNWQRDYNMNEIGLSGQISDKDADEIKKLLSDEFRTIFTEQLTKKGYPVVDKAGPDVLLLRPALLNVDVVAPQVGGMGWGRTWIRSAGGMTLYMEMYDSASSTLLARVVDPQGDQDPFAQQATRASNKAAADQILRAWADLLAKHLGELKTTSAGN